MPSSAWWKWKWLRYKPLENRVYNGNSNWLLTTASKIQYYNTKSSSWDPSSASNLRLADKHLTTKLTNVYRFGFFVVRGFFLAKGTWQVKKIYRSKAKLANSSKVLSWKFLIFFPITASLSTHKTKRRCHTSPLDERSILTDDFVREAWIITKPSSQLYKQFDCSSKGQKFGYPERRRQKRPIALQLLTFPSLHD